VSSSAPIVLLLHGPNLNLLGSREPEVYGTATLADHVATATATAAELGLTVEDLHDALAAFDGPIVELHLSNPNAREPWRHTSVVAPVATGTIVGFGGTGYDLAIRAAAAAMAG